MLKPSGPLANFDGFLSAPRKPLSYQNAQHFSQVVTLRKGLLDGVWDKFSAMAGVTSASVIRDRLTLAKMDGMVSSGVKLFCSLSSPTPPTALLWAYTLCLMVQRSGKKVTLEAFCSPEFFGLGIPDVYDMEKVWIKQKCQNLGQYENWLDYPEYWPRADRDDVAASFVN